MLIVANRTSQPTYTLSPFLPRVAILYIRVKLITNDEVIDTTHSKGRCPLDNCEVLMKAVIFAVGCEVFQSFNKVIVVYPEVKYSEVSIR